VVAKRMNSLYEAGKRSGAWAKFRLNSGQELVVGGYVPGAHGVDSVIVGYHKESELIYVARVRNGLCRKPVVKCSRSCDRWLHPIVRSSICLKRKKADGEPV
jgi:ATP-dependent DNA ligase